MIDESTAVVSSVPAPYRGRVLTQANLIIALGLFLLQILLALAVCFVPALLGVMSANLLFPNDKDLSFLPILAGMGLMFALMWVIMGHVLRHPWSSNYMFAKTKAEFANRPDSLVDPNNAEAILVEVIPRRNWANAGLRSSEDQGFLLVDAEQHQILFEGDNKRYRIPAPAVLSCEVEMVNKDWERDQRAVPVAVVVLTFRDPEGLGEREVPLRPMRTIGGDPLGGNYVERAHELKRRLATLVSEIELPASQMF